MHLLQCLLCFPRNKMFKKNDDQPVHTVAANDQYNDASFNIFSLVIEMMFDCAFIVALSLGAKIT